MNDDELEDELLADADSWDRCYPGNVNIESLVTGLAERLRESMKRTVELEQRTRSLVDSITEALACGSHADQKMDGTNRWVLTPSERERVRSILVEAIK